MSNMTDSFYDIRLLDELAEKKTVIHRLHPLVKVLTTGVYLLVTVSFGKYEPGRLLPLLLYPVLLFSLAEIPLLPILKRFLLVTPLIIGVGIFNPLFDRTPLLILPWLSLSGGWVSFFSLLIKGFLTVTAALLLMATTGITGIAAALGSMKIPKVLIMQLLLVYRYIAVLLEEVSRVPRAYALRSPGEKGIRVRDWGSLTGQLLLRTLDRAQRVYYAMCCRGFQGEYHTGRKKGLNSGDLLFLAGWMLFFAAIRYINLPELAGSLIMGVGK